MQRGIRLIMAFNFLEDFLPYSVFAVLIFADIAGSFTAAAAAFSVTMLASVVFEVPTGVLSDRVGRKATVVLGALFSTAGIVCYALAQDATLIFIGSVIGGISTAFYSGNNDALLYDLLVDHGKEHQFRDYLGRTSSMFQAAGAVSAVIGGVLVAATDYRTILWVTVIPQALSVIVALMLPVTRPHEKSETPYAHLRESIGLIAANPRLRALTTAQVIRFSFGEAGYQLRAAFVETLWPLWAIGAARAFSNVIAALSFYFAGPLIRFFGERRILLGGVGFANISEIVWVSLSNVLSPALMALNSALFGVITVSSGTLMQREFSPRHRATMGSVASLLGSFGFAVVSVVFGVITDLIGPDRALMLMLAGALTSVFWYRVAFRRNGAEPLANS
ncbi:MAG: MFS transporter [Chloroflexi bacterium]|nr:MFS transporter [Chloroflexota bacterium]